MFYPIILIAIFLVGGLGFMYLTSGGEKNVPRVPTPTSTQSQKEYCNPANLQSLIEFSGAAGSIYGNLTIKNVGAQSCDILGSNYITINDKVNNIETQNSGQAGPEIITLQPNQVIYSQVRYQNGPQCSSLIKQTPVEFTYNISPNDHVTFTNQGKTSQNITTCSNASEMTQVTLWNLSTQPING